MASIRIELWTRARDVSAALISACWPGRDFAAVETMIDEAAPLMRRALVVGPLLALALCSFVAAQFGLLGLCIFWIGVIWLIR
ncbi:MAG: hypothetical protein AAFN94_14630 [Pseudomonadota bacterium]